MCLKSMKLLLARFDPLEWNHLIIVCFQIYLFSSGKYIFLCQTQVSIVKLNNSFRFRSQWPQNLNPMNLYAAAIYLLFHKYLYKHLCQLIRVIHFMARRLYIVLKHWIFQLRRLIHVVVQSHLDTLSDAQERGKSSPLSIILRIKIFKRGLYQCVLGQEWAQLPLLH